MDPCVPAQRQLVIELFVSDLQKSLAFYEQLGFERQRVDGNFAVLTWEGCELFLDQRSPEDLGGRSRGNVRVMVADVDRYWTLARSMNAEVFAPLEDRYYGLRDFTILDPDGFGVRFASTTKA